MASMSGPDEEPARLEDEVWEALQHWFLHYLHQGMMSSSPAICVGSQTFLLWTLDHWDGIPNNTNHNNRELS